MSYIKLSIILILLSLTTNAFSNTLTLVSVEKNNSQLELCFKFSDSINEYHVFALENPLRLVLDVKQASLKGDWQKLKMMGEFDKLKIGSPKPNVQRLVMQSIEKITRFDTSFDANKKILLVRLYFSKVRANQSITAIEKKPIIMQKLSNLLEVTRTKPLVVVIDPGHGGHDPGAIGRNGTKEKKVVLQIALKLASLINQHPNMKALLTRKGDYFVPLRDRLELARRSKADLFIAIHADSYFNKHSHGVSVYALSEGGATSEATRWLANQENDSEMGGVDLNELGDKSQLLKSVLIDLAQTATITDSLRLGNLLLQKLMLITKLHYHHVEQAPFVVLKAPDVPSVLVETGFLSNSKEELRLTNENYQHDIANAIYNGIQHYIKKYGDYHA